MVSILCARPLLLSDNKDYSRLQCRYPSFSRRYLHVCSITSKNRIKSVLVFSTSQVNGFTRRNLKFAIQFPKKIQSRTSIIPAKASTTRKIRGFILSAPAVAKTGIRRPGRKRPMKQTSTPCSRRRHSAHLTRESVKKIRRKGKRKTPDPRCRPRKNRVESLR